MQDISIQKKLCDFIQDFGDDLDSLELLLYFCRHPDARFNLTAVFHASSAKRFDTTKSLKRLTYKGLVVTCEESGNKLYTLTRDVHLRGLALGLLQIDQRQWRMIAERILRNIKDL